MTPATRHPITIGSAYDSPYARQLPFPKWTREITVKDDHRLFARLPEFAGWTKLQHYEAAIGGLEAALTARASYLVAVKDACQVYGDGDGRLISGIVRGHFPQHTKEALRFLCGEIDDYERISLSHWRASGRTARTWRRVKDQEWVWRAGRELLHAHVLSSVVRPRARRKRS